MESYYLVVQNQPFSRYTFLLQTRRVTPLNSVGSYFWLHQYLSDQNTVLYLNIPILQEAVNILKMSY